METIAFLGCSRGLGYSVVKEVDKRDLLSQALLVSRSENQLAKLGDEITSSSTILTMDFAKKDSINELLNNIKSHQPSRLFYFAGGGPFGLFSQKDWKDHLWALQVSFLTPSELLHRILSDESFGFVKQVVFIGSLIADNSPDPMASSYASAKHGLKGLVESLQQEELSLDLRFFRPGYMNTDLLPKNAKPRQGGVDLLEPHDVALQFVDWVLDPDGQKVVSMNLS